MPSRFARRIVRAVIEASAQYSFPAAKSAANPSGSESPDGTSARTSSTRSGADPLRLDLYQPANPTGGPVLVWLHGGAWESGTKTVLMPLCSRGGHSEPPRQE